MSGADGVLPCVRGVAAGAVSAFGVGSDAYHAGSAGEPARVAIGTDSALAAAGLLRPIAARAPADLGSAAAPFADRATALLACALGQVVSALDAERPGWRGERIGIALGTSSGGMLTAERFFAGRAAGERPEILGPLARGTTYFAPGDEVLAAFDLAHVERRTLILAACAASTIAIGMAMRWLDRDACDLVLAGGFDGVSVLVASGFEALRATTATVPRPFRKGRDGMCLGEGAGVIALVRRGDERGARALLSVSGFGASTDAVHITAPDATGSGLARAAQAALRDAGQSSVDLVSAHATATPYNDAMEAKAIAAATGTKSSGNARDAEMSGDATQANASGDATQANASGDVTPAADIASRPVVHPFKAQIGHTLGAAGVLETLAAGDALARGVAPAAAGEGELDPEAEVLLLARTEERPLGRALKLSAAFGGANAALVLSASGEDRPARPRGAAFVTAGVHVTSCDLVALAEATGVARDRLARLDTLCRLGVAAVAALAAKVGRGRLLGAGIVAGHGLATIDTNELFDTKKRTRGPTAVEPRAFPGTSPNAIAGECAIVYKLTGPSFATGAGLDGATEALLGAAELVAAGDAARMVVVAADDAGPAARDLLAAAGLSHRPLERGAVALLVSGEASEGGERVDLDAVANHGAGPIGHLALLPWAR